MTNLAPGSDPAGAEQAEAAEGSSDVDVLQFLTAFRQGTSPDSAGSSPAPAGPSQGVVEDGPRPFSGERFAMVPVAAPSASPIAAAPEAQRLSWSLAPPASAAEAPTPAGGGRRRRWERIGMAAVLAVTAGSLTFIAVRNDQSSAKWRRLDQAQVQVSTSAAKQIQTANANIGQLNSEVKSLDSQVASMQTQLSSVANQKEKAIDQTTVFKDLLAAAGQVADNLQGCIAATDQLGVDLNTIVASGDASALGPLQNEATSVAATCAQAQQGNQALQAAIQSAS